MSELEETREIANELLKSAAQGTTADRALALEKATQALKSLSEVEKSQVEINKLTTEEKKARYDMERAARQERHENRQRYITLLTPIATTLVLGLTLLFQTYQFNQTERDKQDASEDAQWSEAVKTISQSGKLSPVAITLNTFLKSKRYADVARKSAVQLLINTNDDVLFTDLFREAFVPLDWKTVDAVLQLDRALGPRINALDTKTFKPEGGASDLSLLTPDENLQYNYIKSVFQEVSRAVGPLLKGPRPQGQRLDLRSAYFRDCDWSGVNLYEADIDNIDLRFVDLKGADLGGISSFNHAFLYGTAWWDANRISRELLDYLIRESPYDPKISYGSTSNPVLVPQQHYEESIARLRASA